MNPYDDCLNALRLRRCWIARLGLLALGVTWLVSGGARADEPSHAASTAARNAWYWDSPVNIHWDNHGNLLGKGLTVDEIVKLFAGVKVDMIQVSAHSGYATYPSRVGVPNPQLDGYDTLATWREVTRRLGTKLWIYINVIDEPHLTGTHPQWQRVDAKGNKTRVCNRPSVDGSGYLEQLLIPTIREIAAGYHPDGFWFDGDWQIPPVCYCGNCRAAWKQATGDDEPPRDAKDPRWPRWIELEQQRLDAYKQQLAEAIHQADPRCCYVSNWSWAISQRDPRTAPAFADTLSGDVGAGTSQNALYASRFAALMLSEQEHTPHDVMSAIYPKNVRTLPRMLQEGGLVMSSGSSWFLWVNQLTPPQFAHLRACYELVDARREALGHTHSINPVAVLLSETSWQAGLTRPEPGYFDATAPRNLAFALQDAGYGVDVVNEQSLREQLAHWKIVVLANQRKVSTETRDALRRFVAAGGTLLVADGGLRPDDADEPEIAALLGLARRPWGRGTKESLTIDGRKTPVRMGWQVEPQGAKTLARLDGRDAPVLTANEVGKGRVVYLALSGFPYPDEDGLALWVVKALGLGPMVSVVGDARDRNLVFSLRRRPEGPQVLHIADLTTYADGKRIEPNSSHQIDATPPVTEVALAIATRTAPKSVRCVPATTRVQWQSRDHVLRLVLRPFQTHAAVIFDADAAASADLLPADFPAAPRRCYPTAATILAEDFENTPVGQFPAKPVWSANVDAKTAIRVAVDPTSAGNHVLEFVDAPDARAGFVPYLLVHPQRLDRGRARLAADFYLDTDARVQIELRDESAGTLVAGPSLRIAESGKIQVAGKDLTTVPRRQWFHLQLDFGLGADAAAYSLEITQPGRPAEQFQGLKGAHPSFSECTWLGILSTATANCRFYVDNLRLERLP